MCRPIPILIGILVAGCGSPERQSPSSPNGGQVDATPVAPSDPGQNYGPASDAEPAEVARRFLIAMASGNLDEASKWSLWDPDLEVLLQGERPPRAALSEARRHIEAMQLTELKVGDSITLSQGRTLSLDEGQINQQRRLFKIAEGPLPMILVHEEDQWKVDPLPIISSRKIAERESTRRENPQEDASAWLPGGEQALQLAPGGESIICCEARCVRTRRGQR